MAQQPSTMSSPEVQVKQVAVENEAQINGRAGVASPNPPSTNLPASVKLESSQPPSPVFVTGKVPFVNPVQTPRVSVNDRVVNDTPPNMSVNLREDFINEASAGHKPLMPNLITRGGTGQVETNSRPDDADEVVSGANPVGSGPIVDPQQPKVTPPIVNAPSPEADFE